MFNEEKILIVYPFFFLLVAQDLNTFWHEVRATVIQPKELREFMDTWGELDSIGVSL